MNLSILLTEVSAIIENTPGLNIVDSGDVFIKIENNRLFWRRSFEKNIKPLLDANKLDLVYSTSFGGYDYLIKNH